MAAICSSPLELLKTRMQAASQASGPTTEPWTAALQQLRHESQVTASLPGCRVMFGSFFAAPCTFRVSC